MRVLVDANVIADAFSIQASRPGGDRSNALMILEAVAQKKITGVITAPIFVFLLHILKPRRKDHSEKIERALEYLLEIMEWAPVTPDHCRSALASSFKDVEDGVEFFAAGKIDAIITRDPKGFKEHVHVPVLNAREFVAKFL